MAILCDLIALNPLLAQVRITILIALCLLAPVAAAQVCHVDEMQAGIIKWDNNPSHSLSAHAAFPKHVGIAFHVLHQGGPENIAIEDLRIQIDVLNDAFEGTGFSFFLALVTRTYNEAWPQLAQEGVPPNAIRGPLSVDPVHLINVFIGDMENEAIGWSVFTDSPNPSSHAVVLDYVALPNGPFDPDFDAGITLVHELGHYFSLRHPYERGCLPDSDKGDFVADTPPASSAWFRQCPSQADSCPTLPGNDPVTNYMYATTDACRMTWTQGQIDRMENLVTEFRPNLGGSEITMASGFTIDAGSEWYFYEGRYQFPPGAQLTVYGNLYAQDVSFTASASYWSGIRLAKGSEGALDNVDITMVSGGAGGAGVTVQNARATLDDVRIDVLPGSYVFGLLTYGSNQSVTVTNSRIHSASAEAVHVSGYNNILYMYNTQVIQNSGVAAVKASQEGSIHFWSGPFSPYVGRNRIAGGRLYAIEKGLINAGNSARSRSRNHFCDAASSQLETSDDGAIYATHNFWYNDDAPSQLGSNIFYGNKLGMSNCTVPPERTDQAAHLFPQHQGAIPETIALRNHPNPFNPTTTISFHLPSNGHVQLHIYDMLGRRIETLIDAPLDSGAHEVFFDATGIPSGSYLYRLVTRQGSAVGMMAVMK